MFEVNDSLRSLHLNLQGSKTDVISGNRLASELDLSNLNLIENVHEKTQGLCKSKRRNDKEITSELRRLNPIVSRFTRRIPESVSNLNVKESRTFRRLMTVYGECGRTRLRKAALISLRQLPELRILKKSLVYLSHLAYKTHDAIVDALLTMLESEELPFPYQGGLVLEAVRDVHPSECKKVASRIRKYGLTKKRHWFVVQKAIEAIMSYPYHSRYAQSLADKYLEYDHPMVRRAACVLLLRGSKSYVRKRLTELTYHPDPRLSRLALYFLRLGQDKTFVIEELSRMGKGEDSDYKRRCDLPRLYAIAATDEKEVAFKAADYVDSLPATKSAKLNWHCDTLRDLLSWSRK